MGFLGRWISFSFDSVAVHLLCIIDIPEVNEYQQLFFAVYMEMLVHEPSVPCQTADTAPKVNFKGNDKNVGESKYRNKGCIGQYPIRGYFWIWHLSKKKDNQLSKAFNEVGWENIVMEFNKKISILYEFM